MPRKPKKPCSYPGCPELTDDRYCEKHRTLENRNYNKYQRDPESNKRYGRSWKRVRDRYIRLHPFCEECERQGQLTKAEEVHHIIPLSRGGTHNTDNLLTVCRSCHNKFHIELGDR